jgi:hypothetical protein
LDANPNLTDGQRDALRLLPVEKACKSISAPTALMAGEWTFATSTTKTSFELPFGPSATGDTVWISAFGQNAKDESGPASMPTSVNLPAGGALPREAEQPTPMRIAA